MRKYDVDRTYKLLRKGFDMDFENLNIGPELREKAKACKTPDELLALAKQEGYKLSDAEMEAVSGGAWHTANSACSSYEQQRKRFEA